MRCEAGAEGGGGVRGEGAVEGAGMPDEDEVVAEELVQVVARERGGVAALGGGGLGGVAQEVDDGEGHLLLDLGEVKEVGIWVGITHGARL